MFPRLRKRALLLAALVGCCSAQVPTSITFLRVSRPIVDKRLQSPPPEESWSTALRKLYLSVGIPAYQIVEQTLPGADEPMVICTIAGHSDDVVVVSTSLARPKDDGKAALAWATLAMLPLLAESINGVVPESTILFIAFPVEKRHGGATAWYVEHLSAGQKKKIKSAVQIANVGRDGGVTVLANRHDKHLLEWLATAALSTGVPIPAKVDEGDAEDLAAIRAFQSASIPVIAVSSWTHRVPASFNASGLPLNKLDHDAYYSTYMVLCVFVLDLDRAAQGGSPKSLVAAATTPPPPLRTSAFTEVEVERMIAGQVNAARTEKGLKTLQLVVMPDLHKEICDMAKSNHVDARVFEINLKEKQLSGEVVVATGTYPSLAPKDLLALRIGRFDKLSVAACSVASEVQKGPTYWVAALAYE